MLKPNRLRRGDKVAIVSLSSGILGEDWAIHKFYIAKERLEKEYGLEVVAMPNALKGSQFIYEHPEARAKDLMDAFRDTSIKAIFNAIGGDDSIRILPFIDYDVIQQNPKIFTGFSDTTVTHFIMQKAGVISYYGASVMNNWAEYVEINPYTKDAIEKMLFYPTQTLDIPSAPYWYDDEDEKIWWKPENQHRKKAYHPETIGYEILQGHGVVEGQLIGGCVEVLDMINGTEIWPKVDEWKSKILFLETSEDDISEDNLVWILRNFHAQRIFHSINGIIFAKPAIRSKHEAYKRALQKVITYEAGLADLPILYNVNVGHAEPIGILPIGIHCRIDADSKTLTLLEGATQ